jgi:hypothetical protein
MLRNPPVQHQGKRWSDCFSARPFKRTHFCPVATPELRAISVKTLRKVYFWKESVNSAVPARQLFASRCDIKATSGETDGLPVNFRADQGRPPARGRGATAIFAKPIERAGATAGFTFKANPHIRYPAASPSPTAVTCGPCKRISVIATFSMRSATPSWAYPFKDSGGS